ncbi:hypothetical protein SteCoe_14141 [Stentor coeruleus]|uniref:TNFR-Cys domain-containing protein n=1 Tax=Stentor coeruleus TaxID=5963 RepID=A0A1R2C6N2_9CILI|nr:hypothetical protein SteCoe_14141 [Stentor coeruleus]
MAVMFLAFFFYLACQVLSLTNCIQIVDDKCTSCSNSYLILPICSLICPSKYSISGSECISSETLPILFSLEFSKVSSLTEMQIGNFVNQNSEAFQSPTKNTPLPTKDRGFFFSSTSLMICNEKDLIPSPFFTIKAWAKIESPGIIFQITDTQDYFCLQKSDEKIQISIKVLDLEVLNKINTVIFENSISDNWCNIVVSLDFKVTGLELTLKVNNLLETVVKDNWENAISNEGSGYEWYLGNSVSSFKGFLYMLVFVNALDTTLLEFYDIPNCPSVYFFDGQCEQCPISCPSLWPWCVRDDCSYCYSKNTDSCTGYAYENAQNPQCPNHCIECKSMTICDKSEYYYYINSYFTYEKYYNEEILDYFYVFMDNMLPSYYLQSGENANTDYFTDPENDDYIPLSHRGFYFGPSSYGITRKTHIIPSEFYISIWLKGTNGPAVYKNKAWEISFNGDFSIFLSSTQDYNSYTKYSYSITLDYTWHYIGYKILYYNFDTTIKIYIDEVQSKISNEQKAVFRDTRGEIYFGTNLVNYFQGFILKFWLYNNPLKFENSVFSLIDYKNNFGYSECAFDQSSFSECTDCDIKCLKGCSLTYICGPCYERACKVCSTTSFCLECYDGFSLDNGVCEKNRGDCMSVPVKKYSCSSCNDGFLLYEDFCLLECPSGFYALNGKCVVENENFVNIDFAGTQELGILNGFIVGNNNLNTYPTYDSNDPEVIINRGYYFSTNKGMTSTNIVLSPSFIISFWGKLFSEGNIVKKSSYLNIDYYDNCIGISITDIYNIKISKHFDLTSPCNWAYYKFSVLFNEGSTFLKVYYNTQTQINEIISNFLYEDTSSNTFSLGTSTFQSSDSFNGILWTLDIYNSLDDTYNDYADNCVNCLICDFNKKCPGNCDNEIYYDCDLQCLSCKIDDLCVECNDGYIKFINYNRCLLYTSCPTGFSSSNTCEYLGTSKVLNIEFNKISDNFNDIIGSAVLQSGLETSAHPNYSENDVRAAKGRGVYFNNKSIMNFGTDTSTAPILAPEFIIGFWIRIQENGIIFTKKSTVTYIQISISYQNLLFKILQTNGEIASNSISFTTYNTWNLIIIGKKLSFIGDILIIKVNDQTQELFTKSYYNDNIINPITYIGDLLSSFKGFLWSIEIYCQNSEIVYTQTETCIYPLTVSECLSICEYNEYYNNNNCFPCSNCDNSCGFENSCNLCDDILCSDCPDYSTCLMCTENSIDITISNPCKCKSGTFQNIDKCILCHYSCDECNGDGVLYCINCALGFMYFIDYKQCLPGDFCPTSYGNDDNCIFNGIDYIFSIEFNIISDVFYDLIYNTQVTSGQTVSGYLVYNNDDVKAAKGRGVYFNELAWMNVDNNPGYDIILGPEFSVVMWVMVMKNGYIYVRNSESEEIFSIQFTDGITISLLTISLETIIFTHQSLSSTNSWCSISIVKTLEGNNESLDIIINGISDLHTYSKFYKDTIVKSSYFGKSSYSFTGFLWSFDIYNQPIIGLFNTGVNCKYPTTEISCLSSCNYNQILIQVCVDCPSNCQTSCGYADSCVLCDDILCAQCPLYTQCNLCTTYSSKSAITGLCECDLGYGKNIDKCEPCHFSCKKCTTSSYTGCVICMEGFLYFEDFKRCINIENCPTGYSLGADCAQPSTQAIFSIFFNSIQSIYYDLISKIPIISSDGLSSYPYLTNNDVRPAKNRGVYFTSNSYMQISESGNSKILLGPEFSISSWVLVFSNGVFFSRFSTENILSINFNSNIYCNINCYEQSLESFISYTKWMLINIILKLNGDGQEFIIYINNSPISILSSIYFIDTISSTTILGNSASSFIGFLWSLEIYPKSSLIGLNFQDPCFYPLTSSNCLNKCEYNNVPDSLCTPCMGNCTFSCGFADSCNLCDDILCISCIEYSECITCTNNAHNVNNVCICNDGFARVADTCQLCHFTCLKCFSIDELGCTECINDYVYLKDYKKCISLIACPTGYNEPNCGSIGDVIILNVVFNENKNTYTSLNPNVNIVSGESDNYYPYYEINDVYSVKGRGIYFMTGSYMQIGTGNEFLLGPELNIAIWLLAYNLGDIFIRNTDSQILLKVELQSEFIFSGTLFEDTFSQSGPSGLTSQWQLVQAILKLEEVKIIINDASQYTILTSYYKDSGTFLNTILGGQSGFQGYIWSLQIYNKPIIVSYNSGFDCVYPIDISSCLPICFFNQFLVSSSCNDCLSSCEYSCGFIDSCTLCDDLLCLLCSDYATCENCKDHATIVGFSCTCDDGYAKEGDACLRCHDSCKTCNDISYLGCKTCATGYMSFPNEDNRCLPITICPTHYGTNNQCYYDNTGLLFSMVFNKIQNSYLHSISKINAYSGFTTDYYPAYEIYDAFSVRERGIYFKKTSFITIDDSQGTKIILGPIFTLSFWIKIIDDGIIFLKSTTDPIPTTTILISSTSKILSSKILTLNGYYEKNSTSTQYINEWSLIYIKKILKNDGESLIINVNGIINFLDYPSYYNESLTSIITLGKSDISFEGFLWSFEIYTNDYTPSQGNGVNCIFPLDVVNCLPNCLVNEFYYNLTCVKCMNNCSYSCGFDYSCNICNQDLCIDCPEYSECLKCTSNSYLDLDNNCTCFKGYYHYKDSCILCHYSCVECFELGYNGCTLCKSGFMNFTDYKRCLPAYECPTHYGDDVFCKFTENYHLLSMTFDHVQNKFYDSTSGISIESGRGSMFFPEYEPSDIYATVTRGVYFHKTSYMKIGNKINSIGFGPEFTLSFWILINDQGKIFSRSNYTMTFLTLSYDININFTITTLTGQQEIIYNKDFSLNKWHLLQIVKELFDDGEKIIIYVDMDQYTKSYLSYYKDMKKTVATQLGSSTMSFVGFLWSLDFKSQSLVLDLNIGVNCFYPIDISTCLPDCSIDTYYNTTLKKCDKCLPRCLTCTSSYQCNLCDDPLCWSCSDSSSCELCKVNSGLIDKKCSCDRNYIYNADKEECEEMVCFYGCYKCTNTTVYDCISCDVGYTFKNSKCLKIPTGYILKDKEYIESNDIVFSVTLNKIQGLIKDDENMIPILTGNSIDFYPNYDSEDPRPVPMRGYYFDGISSILRLPEFQNLVKPDLVLGTRWGIQIWYIPISYNGVLAYSSSSIIDIFSIYFINSSIVTNITLITKNHTNYFIKYSKTSQNTIVLNEWNSIYMYINDSDSYTLTLYINNIFDSIHTLDNGVFINSLPSTFITIGGQPQVSYFKGFIYRINFYAKPQSFFSRFLVSSCSVPIDGQCLPTCNIGTYWIGPGYNDCGKCNDYCPDICFNDKKCNLCYDPLCEICADYEDGSCSKCIEYASGINNCTCQSPYYFDQERSICYYCLVNQFYDGNQCVDCPSICLACTNQTYCIACSDNASLKNGECKCKLGFYDNGKLCDASIFYANFTITGFNTGFLEFNEPPNRVFTSSDIAVETCTVFSYTIEKFTEKKYYVNLSFNKKVPNECYIKIIFVNPLNMISVKNGIMINTTFEDVLLPSVKTSYEVYMAQKASSEKMSISITSGSTATTISMSFLNNNPACLWSFISAIQMLCFIDLIDYDLPANFAGYLKGLKKYNQFPNFFSEAISESAGVKPFDRAYNFGYKTNLLLLNVGNYISAILSMIGILLLTLILLQLKNFKPFSYKFIQNALMKILKSYKYASIVRFWITCYLEVFAASLIALVTPFEYTATMIINIVFSILIIIAVIMTPILFFYFTYKKRMHILHEVRDENANWGTLFYEFNNDKGLASSQYYFYYFIRRISYMLIQFFLRSLPLFQMSMNMTLSLAMIVYILAFRPFSEMILNIANAISEASILFIFIMMTISMMEIQDDDLMRIDYSLVSLINIIMFTQMTASILVFSKNLFAMIKKRREIRVVPMQKTYDSPTITFETKSH